MGVIKLSSGVHITSIQKRPHPYEIGHYDTVVGPCKVILHLGFA